MEVYVDPINKLHRLCHIRQPAPRNDQLCSLLPGDGGMDGWREFDLLRVASKRDAVICLSNVFGRSLGFGVLRLSTLPARVHGASVWPCCLSYSCKKCKYLLFSGLLCCHLSHTGQHAEMYCTISVSLGGHLLNPLHSIPNIYQVSE